MLTHALYQLVVENVRSGATPGELRRPPARYEIQNRETTIGRSSACTIRLDDMFVSRRHARLILRDLELHLEDLESTNQSRVNGAPVPTRVQIHPGDILLFGGAHCRIESVGETGAPDRSMPDRSMPDRSMPDRSTSPRSAPPPAVEERADSTDPLDAGVIESLPLGAAEMEEPEGPDAELWLPANPPTLYVAGPLPGEPGRTRSRLLLMVLVSVAVLAAAFLLLR